MADRLILESSTGLTTTGVTFSTTAGAVGVLTGGMAVTFCTIAGLEGVGTET